ncbi:FAD-dependent monooxygenase [Amycolatopsis saalfeldensis]|uniref:2-polyprenyl-6-methoxyphenol hydroxylase n=1 Tax=Amycolatopsis saalfeldensis TaxID=394193 RepID=A0A1H8XEZ5_9PSEU|nr:FAD-dependent monooxygenase [Amycolatopsis saalfeldensis]SEP38392.1 2-polyprenyl-6-methoxyphenol hydroxylase [Amycolatopsis saalfeldensis]
MNTTKRALIVGSGIAGMAAALSLHRAGWAATIVEKSPRRRTGGYFIALYTEGMDAARTLGVFDQLHTRTPRGTRTWDVDAFGNRTRSVGLVEARPNAAAVLRGDVEEALWANLGDIPVRFGLSPESVDERPDGVEVRLRDGHSGAESTERFDLVVGADGVRSRVRSLVFGGHEKFLRPLNAIACAFQFDEQTPYVAPADGSIFAEPGRALWVFPLDDRPPTALFTYRTKDEDGQFTRPPKQVIRDVFRDVAHADLVRHALDQLDRAPEMSFDSVHQVELPSWHTDRVVLVGDAAWCMTVYAGLGASSALMGGQQLGETIERHPGDVAAALVAWEASMRPFVREGQRAGRVKQQIFVPANGFRARLRRRMMQRSGRKFALRDAQAALATA